MCGIVGFTGLSRPGMLQSMAAAIHHRGPDDEGFLELPDVSLAMRRLAIVDLATGRQPIGNETEDVWVVFNGEIYNHAAIRRELTEAGHRFRTSHADTETIVHAYEEYGLTWPEKVGANGMFALALWDARQERLLLYRDRMGKKPLYYATVNNGHIVFASEIKALLLHPDISRELDRQALVRYFMLKHISAPATAYSQVRQLPPGHFLIWEKNRDLKIAPYWSLSFSPGPLNVSEDEAAQQLIYLLEDAVALRMNCDVPYGSYLSGGVDSTAVTALMCRRQSAPVKTFCLGYADEATGQFAGKAQDLHYARLMAGHLGTDHHEMIITAQQFAADMPRIIAAFDEPFSGTISTWFLSILIKEHVKVALSGDGADELFGSYLAHRLAFPIENWLALQRQGKNEWQELTAEDLVHLRPFDSGSGFSFLRSVAHPDQGCWRERLGVFSPNELHELLTPEFLEPSGSLAAESFWSSVTKGLTAADALNRTLEVDQRDLLPNQILPFVDRLSMAHSIEVRCPYLDHRIVALANSLSGKMKIKNGITKYIHKKALTGLLPDDLLHRPKEGFVQPIYSWMHGTLRPWVLEELRSLPSKWIQEASLSKLIAGFQAGDTKLNAKIWNLVCFALWYNQHPE
ncbi:MAG: asparagine synthase (glutamine-hydrolyzing) [Desulfobacteraceae bacterium]|nr:MAG: asparagine synthase (glutamine-hydrolyzing) [Desulfobacteraceae bacterium]